MLCSSLLEISSVISINVITGTDSISVTCYDSIYVLFLLLPTSNIYRVLTVLGSHGHANQRVCSTLSALIVYRPTQMACLWQNM